MQKKIVLRNNIKNLLTAMFVFLPFILIPSCKADLIPIWGNSGNDISEELEKNHGVEIIFYDEFPETHPNAKKYKKLREIGKTYNPADFFPTEEMRGNRAADWRALWKYYNPDDPQNKSPEPPNTVKTKNGKIESVTVSLKTLSFYAEWYGKSKYQVLYRIQDKYLKRYLDLEKCSTWEEYYELITNLGAELYPVEKEGYYDSEIPLSECLIEKIPGFVCNQEKTEFPYGNLITKDNNAKVIFYYDRVPFSITIKSEVGTFVNYPYSTEVKFPCHYGCPFEPPILEKKNCKVVGFINDNTGEEVETIKTFSTEDVSYTVHWEEADKEKYTVRHWLQTISATRPDYGVGEIIPIVSGGNTYYKYYVVAKATSSYDYPGTYTQADFATTTLIPNIENYTRASSSITQLPIAANGSTVIDIYYDLIPIEVTLDPNGGFGSPFTQTFYTETDCITIRAFDSTGFGRSRYGFSIWNTKPDGSGIDYNDQRTIAFKGKPAEPITLYVQWKEINKVKYYVRYKLQEISAEWSPNASGTISSGGKTYYTSYNTVQEITLEGFPGEYTEAEFATPELISNIGNYSAAISKIEQTQINADGSTVIEICYDVKPFEITLSANNGTGTAITQTFFTETNCITIQSSNSLGFEMKNHKFASWNTKADETGTRFSDEATLAFTSVPATPITLYTQWKEIKKVTYKIIHKIQNTSLSAYDIYETETREDYPESLIDAADFAKKYKGFSCSFSDAGIVTEDGSAEFSVYYDRNEVSIIINSEVGTFVDYPSVTSILIYGVYGTDASIPELAKKNHKLLGFVKDGSSDVISTISVFPAESETYTAKWIELGKATYKVRHLLQKVMDTYPNGIFGNASDSIVMGDEIRSGGKTYYTYYEVETETSASGFLDEYTNAQAATDTLISNIGNYNPQRITQMPIAEDDTTVVDVFYDVKPFEITLDPNDGTGNATGQTFYTETNCIAIMDVYTTGFSKNHYHFAGWNTEADGTGILYSDGQAIAFTFEPENQITLYAQWRENAQIEYKIRHLLQAISPTAPSGTESEDIGNTGQIISGGITYYTYYEIGIETSDSDYVGETTNAQFATTELIPNIENYEPQTILQKTVLEDGSTIVDVFYNVKPFEITLDAGNGDGNQISQTFYTETSCIRIEPFANTGFSKQDNDFDGWNTNADGSGIGYADSAILSFTSESPKTLYAQWKTNVAYNGITVSFTPPINSDISIPPDTSTAGQVTVTVTIPSNIRISSYAWEIDGIRSSETGNTLTIRTADYAPGYHTFICIVKDSNGKIYIGDGWFAVEEGDD